jgi:hypothetical protein
MVSRYSQSSDNIFALHFFAILIRPAYSPFLRGVVAAGVGSVSR